MTPAAKVIDTFGGLSATSRVLGVPVTTIQGWKERGRVPQEHWPKIISEAAKVDKPIGVSELAGLAA